MYTFYWYPKCSTCKKAKAWLDQHKVSYEAIDMVEQPPKAERLATWIEESSWPMRRFFNTSGQRYRQQGLKELVDGFSVTEASQRLAADGMLIKRPILVKDNQVLALGFKESDYEGAVAK